MPTLPPTPITATTYTLGNKDSDQALLFQNTAACVVSLDPAASPGAGGEIHQDSAGGVSFSASGGASIVNSYGFSTIAGQNCSVWWRVLDNVGGSAARFRLDGQLTSP